MSLSIEFNCDFDENNIGNLTDEPSANFSFKFNYNNNYNNNFTTRFSSEVRSISQEELQEFIDDFKNDTKATMSFNDNNGSCVIYNERKINFHVFTWKEGAFTVLDTEFLLDEDNHSKMIEFLNTLLEFKEDYDDKIYDFYREDDDDEYNDDDGNEINPADERR